MSRLIDADDLIEYIKIWEIGNSISSDQKEFIDCINRQPTVFDVDEVVRQLDTYITKLVGKNSALYQTVMQKIEGSAVDICINQVLNFRIYAYDDGKIAWMKLPQDIEKRILNLNVDSYKIKSYSKESVYVNIEITDIDKDGIFIRN